MLPRDRLGGHGVLVTGATGLVGARCVRVLLERDPTATVYALARAPGGLASDLLGHERVVPVPGDVTKAGLALAREQRRALARRVGIVIHAAADTRFSQTLAEARRSNTVGTAHVLELVTDWPGRPRFCFVSTAFVAGKRTGRIAEDGGSDAAGWVNMYERSKFEAERLVRSSGLAAVVCRCSTIVCDGPAGHITQFNAAHRALEMCRRSLVPMLPGAEDTPVDTVPCDFVARAIVDLVTRPDTEGTYHLVAGRDALSLGEILDAAYAYWTEIDGRRPPIRPILTDLETYRLFEATALETAEPDLRRVTRALSHFVPQLALPKVFGTARVERTLGYGPPPVRSYWGNVLRTLTALRSAPRDDRRAERIA